jgi:hypothetical protein
MTRAIIGCRKARSRLAALARVSGAITAELEPVERHLENCEACSREFNLIVMTRAALDAAACEETITADESFYKSLRARIARGPDQATVAATADSWAAAVLLTARQLMPLMALLLLLMIGASVLWKSAPPSGPSLAGNSYDFVEPTPDDVLDSLAAVEERDNGK